MKRSRIAVCALLTVSAALTFVGCNKSNKTDATKSEAAAMGAVNDKCPFTGGAVNKSVTSTYDGKTIGFCCGNCQGKFAKMTDAQKAETLAKATAKK